MLNQEYIASIVVILVQTLKAFGIELGSDIVTSIVTGTAALYAAIVMIIERRSTVLGKRV